MQPLVLASASSGRKMLLEDLGIAFDVMPSTVDEDGHPEKNPAERAVILARLKAEEVHARMQDLPAGRQARWVLGADTLVVAHDGTLLEKAQNEDEARAMMELQSGHTSIVHSAACLISPEGKRHEGLSSSKVHFQKLDEATIDWWIKGGYWKGKSGSFEIGGRGPVIIKDIEGDWAGVVGLSLHVFSNLCKEAGYPLLDQI